MGKKGDALRAAKAARITKTFTEEQLREHDRQVIAAYKQNADQHMRKVWSEYDHEQQEYRSPGIRRRYIQAVWSAVHDDGRGVTNGTL